MGELSFDWNASFFREFVLSGELGGILEYHQALVLVDLDDCLACMGFDLLNIQRSGLFFALPCVFPCI